MNFYLLKQIALRAGAVSRCKRGSKMWAIHTLFIETFSPDFF